MSGYVTGAVVSNHASDGIKSRQVSGGGISRMVANGTLLRPATGRAVPQVYSEVGPWLYVLILLVLIALLAFFYLSQTSHVATQVSQMRRLEEQVQQLKRENNAILVEISQYQDMSRIQRAATAMGLAAPQEWEYVEVWLNAPSMIPGDSVLSDTGAVHDEGAGGMGSTASAGLSLPAFWSGVLQQFQSWVCAGRVSGQSLSD